MHEGSFTHTINIFDGVAWCEQTFSVEVCSHETFALGFVYTYHQHNVFDVVARCEQTFSVKVCSHEIFALGFIYTYSQRHRFESGTFILFNVASEQHRRITLDPLTQ